MHGVRHVADLAYQEMLEKDLFEHEILGDIIKDKLIYYPTVTREPFRNQGRISDQIENGTFPQNIGLPRSTAKPTGSCCAAAPDAGHPQAHV